VYRAGFVASKKCEGQDLHLELLSGVDSRGACPLGRQEWWNKETLLLVPRHTLNRAWSPKEIFVWLKVGDFGCRI
jgi:hypothetical protein